MEDFNFVGCKKNNNLGKSSRKKSKVPTRHTQKYTLRREIKFWMFSFWKCMDYVSILSLAVEITFHDRVYNRLKILYL